MLKRLMGLVLAVLVVAGSMMPAAAQDDSGSEWCVAAWYPSSEHPEGYATTLAHADVLDVVHPFWYAANPDGSLRLQAGAEDAEKLAAWREAGLQVIPTIAHASPLAIGDERTRAAHVESIVELVERMDYAGIDIDYEEFPLDTRDAFSSFVEALAERLHADGRLLTIAVHAKTEDHPGWDAAAAQDWPRLTAAVDVFNIMTYDYHSGASREAGPIGPPDWSAAVLQYAQSVTDLSKVRLGLHFYGYRWQRRAATVVTWESAQRAAESFGLAFERDPASQEATLIIDVTGLPRQEFVVADAAGLDAKLTQLLAEYPDLGGVAIWGLGGEDPANWEVLQAHRPGDCP